MTENETKLPVVDNETGNNINEKQDSQKAGGIHAMFANPTVSMSDIMAKFQKNSQGQHNKQGDTPENNAFSEYNGLELDSES